jgi:hypothetical protein
MTKTNGIPLLVAGFLLGCDARHEQKAPDGSLSTPEAGLDPCTPSTDYLKCDGNNVLSCACSKQGAALGTDLVGKPLYACDAYSWIPSSVCTVACDTSINPTTGCLASTHPVPECAHDGLACWNGNQTFCLKGYPLPTTPCTTGTQCTSVAGCGALCLGEAETPDPRCPALPGLSNDFCADNTAYHCACGYLIGTQVCGPAPNTCVTVPSYDSFDSASGPYATCGLPP